MIFLFSYNKKSTLCFESFREANEVFKIVNICSWANEEERESADEENKITVNLLPEHIQNPHKILKIVEKNGEFSPI